jgi:hypothetical protein
MKGITAQQFYTYLLILILIVSAYISLPEMVWIVQRGTTDKICPTFLNDNSEESVQLENGGKIPAFFNVTFSSDKIRFIDDNGNIRESISIAYRVDADTVSTFKFKPTFDENVKNSYIQIAAECSTFFGKFCKNSEMYKCCQYSRGIGDYLSLTKEASGKC